MFTTVIWASDGSEHADRALEYATKLASSEGAALHAVHVVEKLVGPRVGRQNAFIDEGAVDAKIKQQTEVASHELDASVTLHMTAGAVGEEAKLIAQTAAQTDADLIVVGTRGRSALAGALLGSVTQRLLHVAHCPVLVIPPATALAMSAETAESVTTSV